MKRLVCAFVVAAVAAPLAATAAPAAVRPVVIPIRVENGRPAGGIGRPTVRKGTLVRIVISSNAGREVHLHGYDIERPVRKGRPTVVQFTARLVGRFELEMHRPDALLARLTVRP